MEEYLDDNQYEGYRFDEYEIALSK